MRHSHRFPSRDGAELASILRQIRLDLRKRAKEVAARAGISKSHLSAIELGQRVASWEMFDRISRALGA